MGTPWGRSKFLSQIPCTRMTVNTSSFPKGRLSWAKQRRLERQASSPALCPVHWIPPRPPASHWLAPAVRAGPLSRWGLRASSVRTQISPAACNRVTYSLENCAIPPRAPASRAATLHKPPDVALLVRHRAPPPPWPALLDARPTPPRSLPIPLENRGS